LPTNFADQDPSLSASGDEDGDGLPNAEEFNHRTDPFSADTDHDGLTACDEIHGYTTYGYDEAPEYYTTESTWGTDPDTGESIEQTYTYWTEEGGRSYEYTLPPTNPTNADTDGDGLVMNHNGAVHFLDSCRAPGPGPDQRFSASPVNHRIDLNNSRR